MKPQPSSPRPTLVKLLRAALAVLLAIPVWAQNPPPPKEDQPRFGATVRLVTAPVTVLDGERHVAGLEKQHFRVFDNDQEQEITGFDVSFLPISLVICIQSDSRVEGLLPQIQKTGILYSDLVLGEQGEAAVIAFDGRVEVRQDFTMDSTKLSQAIRGIRAGNDATHLADAVWRAVHMLRTRPENRRRVMVVLSESRENGSETELGEALRDAQLHNILIYPIRLSTTRARLARPAQPKRDVFPPGVAARPTAPGVVNTPTAQAQSHVEVVNVLPVIIEAVRGVKNLIFNDPLQLLAEGSGGRVLAPLTEAGLQDSVGRIGEELHSQYLLSYYPNNLTVGGFHRIRIQVERYKARTRPGYWYGPLLP